LNRTVAMVDRYFAGDVQAYVAKETSFEESLEKQMNDTVKQVEEAMDHMQFSVALSSIWQLISRTNKYIDETEPWVLAKDDAQKARLGNVMAHLVESLRMTAIMLQPFLTEAPGKIWEQLGIADESLHAWDSLLTHGNVQAGTKIQKGDPIFPRLDVEEETEKIKGFMQGPAQEEEEGLEVKEAIDFSTFESIDLRVAEVVEAEKMENADKLLKLQLDFGAERRQVISVIAEYYEAEELVGRKVICVANLKPVKLRGEMSNGMILSGEDEDGNLSLAAVDQSLPNGSVVK